MPAVPKAIPRVSTTTLGDLRSLGLSVAVIGDKQSGGEINHLTQNQTKLKPIGTSLCDLLLRGVVSEVGSDAMHI